MKGEKPFILILFSPSVRNDKYEISPLPVGDI